MYPKRDGFKLYNNNFKWQTILKWGVKLWQDEIIFFFIHETEKQQNDPMIMHVKLETCKLISAVPCCNLQCA